MKRILLAAALAFAFAGCGPKADETDTKAPADPEFANATPEASAFDAEVTGDATEKALTVEDGDTGSRQDRLINGVPEYLVATRAAVKGLNAIVAAVMVPIGNIIKNNPDAKTGDSHVWGPKDSPDGKVTWRFTMKKAADKKFGWLLEGKPKGATDDKYVKAMAGAIQVGEQAHRGRGILGIDLDAIASLDSTVKGKGKLLCGFAHGKNDGKYLAYALKDFTVDASQYQPVSALFRAIRGPLGGTIVRFAVYANQSWSKDAATKELMVARVRWLPGIGGRADAAVVKGDVPDNHAYVANSCWNAQEKEGYQKISDCDATLKTCTDIKTEGDLATCANALKDAKTPSPDPMTAEDEDTASVQAEAGEVPPTDMPDGSGK